MNQISLITELIYKQQQQEVLNEVAGYRLVREAAQANKQDGNAISRFLVSVGKLLQYAGFALEDRYGGQFDVTSQRIQKYSQGDCA